MCRDLINRTCRDLINIAIKFNLSNLKNTTVSQKSGHWFATYSMSWAFPIYVSKDALPTPSISNVIYRYECLQCGSQSVGKTSQRLGEHIRQHVPRHLVEPAPDTNQRRKHGRPQNRKFRCLITSPQSHTIWLQMTFPTKSIQMKKFRSWLGDAVHITWMSSKLCTFDAWTLFCASRRCLSPTCCFLVKEWWCLCFILSHTYACTIHTYHPHFHTVHNVSFSTCTSTPPRYVL